MPRVWSWYHSVRARSGFGYWKTANPGPQDAPNLSVAFCSKKSYQVPFVAYSSGIPSAAGRYHASAYPSLSSPTPTAPCRWVTIGTGPV